MSLANTPQEPNGRDDAEVNDDLILDSYMQGGSLCFVLHDPEKDESTPVDPDLLTPTGSHL